MHGRLGKDPRPPSKVQATKATRAWNFGQGADSGWIQLLMTTTHYPTVFLGTAQVSERVCAHVHVMLMSLFMHGTDFSGYNTSLSGCLFEVFGRVAVVLIFAPRQWMKWCCTTPLGRLPCLHSRTCKGPGIKDLGSRTGTRMQHSCQCRSPVSNPMINICMGSYIRECETSPPMASIHI